MTKEELIKTYSKVLEGNLLLCINEFCLYSHAVLTKHGIEPENIPLLTKVLNLCLDKETP